MTQYDIVRLAAEGRLEDAIYEARTNKYMELCHNLMKSKDHIGDPNNYLEYYRGDWVGLPNTRIPGAQLANGYGLDSRQQAAARHIEAFSHGETLLDVGCADGTFIFNCLETGLCASTVGVDPWIRGIQWAREFGDKNWPGKTNWHQGLFESFNIDRKFDAIHIGECLEHVIDPLEVMAKAKTFLAMDGGIVITVPLARPALTKDEYDLVQSGQPNQHVRAFTKESVVELVESCDMKVTDLEAEGTHWVNLIATIRLP